MTCLLRNAGYFVGGGGILHSDVSSWTERRPCFRNYEFTPWLYFPTVASEFLTVLKLAEICSRTIVTTDDAHKVYFCVYENNQHTEIYLREGS
jgi:hypothetical protein